MKKYNKQDVLLLEKVYKKLRPWTPRHPNLSVFGKEDRPVCPHCASEKMYKDGKYHTNTNTYQAWECQDCGGWSRSRQHINSKTYDPTKLIVCDRR